MCLLNYNKEIKKYKHLTYSQRTIRREKNRGKVIVRGYEWEDIEEYSAMVAQNKYEYEKTGKGPELILDREIELVNHIEKEITINKKSPEVIVQELESNRFKIKICARTIQNSIKSGLIFEKIDKEKIIIKIKGKIMNM